MQKKWIKGITVLCLPLLFSACASHGLHHGSGGATPMEMSGGEDGPAYISIEKTVVKMAIAKDISLDEAVESMKLRANELNIKLVAELPLSKQIKAMGESSRRMAIYQFCDALTAKKMVEYDINFAAYLPCRISLVEDSHGRGWLLMMDLDLLINDPNLDESLRKTAAGVRDSLIEIMTAGANGEL
ncbi:MAG: DUF302 domain-containing protein [Thiohalomonadales bacterium]